MTDNLNVLDAAYRSLVLSMAGANEGLRSGIPEATILGNTSGTRERGQVNLRRQKISFTTAAGRHEGVGVKCLTRDDMSEA